MAEASEGVVMAKDPETLAELRAVLASHMECWRAYDASVSETITRLEALLKLADAVCEAWADLEPMSNCSALRGKQLLAMQRVYDAYLAGKEKDDGEEMADKAHANGEVDKETNCR